MNSSGDDPPQNLTHSTTTSILRRAATSSLSLLPTFLSISLLLFSFRILVENGTVLVTSYLDSDPSLRALLSRLDHIPSHSKPSSNPNNPNNPHSSRNRPFLHLSRLATLHHDLFSLHDEPHHPYPLNSTTLKLGLPKLGFTIADHGIKFHEVVRQHPLLNFKIDEAEKNDPDGNNLDFVNDDVENDGDLRFLVIGGLELGRRDAAALFFVVCVLSAAYGWVILAFVVTYSWVFGVVFVAVVNDLLGRYVSFLETVWSGSNLGVKRLSGFILMRWAVRDALTQILGLWFFGEIEDQYSFFKLFLRLKLMPFSVSSPWVEGYEKEVSGFLFAWFLVDTIVAFVFAVDSWVTIVSTRRGGREIVKEGLYLLGTMIHQSIQLKCLELILCGAFSRWVLARLVGKSFAVLLQSVVEVYFMVAWLVFYLAARQKDASLSGRRFGRRELEGLIEGLR